MYMLTITFTNNVSDQTLTHVPQAWLELHLKTILVDPNFGSLTIKKED